MREILFRGKRVDNGKWVEGYYFCSRNPHRESIHKIHPLDSDWSYEINPETVGQYTGLTDKNGKKIFEGDIYTWRDGGDYHACLICFGNYFDGYADRYATMARGFYVKPLDGGTFNFAGAGYSEIEISGNIHDNPDLLDVEE